MNRFRDTDYFATTCGKIWSDKSHKFLNLSVNNKDGYHRVMLSIDGKQYMFLRHRVIAECYLDNSDHLPLVNHKDGIKSHCWVDNLEWSTVSHNNKHAIDNNLHRKLSDGLNGMSREVECLEDNKWITYPSSATLARKLNVNRSTITHALKRKNPLVCGLSVRYRL